MVTFLFHSMVVSQGSEREVEAADLSKALNLSSRSVTSCIISASWC